MVKWSILYSLCILPQSNKMQVIAMGLLKLYSEREGKDGKLLGVDGTGTEPMSAAGLIFASSAGRTVKC